MISSRLSTRPARPARNWRMRNSGAVGGAGHVEALALEVVAHELDHVALVVDDQDGAFAGRGGPAAEARADHGARTHDRSFPLGAVAPPLPDGAGASGGEFVGPER